MYPDQTLPFDREITTRFDRDDTIPVELYTSPYEQVELAPLRELSANVNLVADEQSGPSAVRRSRARRRSQPPASTAVNAVVLACTFVIGFCTTLAVLLGIS